MAGRAQAVPVRMTIKRERKLRRIIAAGTSAQRLVLRARIVLAAAEGKENAAIARGLGCSTGTVRLWRGRFPCSAFPGSWVNRGPGGRRRTARACAGGRRDRDAGPAGWGVVPVAGDDRPPPARTRPGDFAGHRRAGPRGRGRPPAQGERLAQPRRRPLVLVPRRSSVPVGCHNARTVVLGRAFLDRQAALWYSLINPLTAVRRLIRAVMSMASLGSCTGG